MKPPFRKRSSGGRSSSRRVGFSTRRLAFLAVVIWIVVMTVGYSQFRSVQNQHVFTLQLLHLDPPIDIRMKVFAEEAPDAARFLDALVAIPNNQKDCNLYRAEPVPEYWGSPDYPDRWFDGGRWGPPYALLQGQLQAVVA